MTDANKFYTGDLEMKLALTANHYIWNYAFWVKNCLLPWKYNINYYKDDRFDITISYTGEVFTESTELICSTDDTDFDDFGSFLT